MGIAKAVKGGRASVVKTAKRVGVYIGSLCLLSLSPNGYTQELGEQDPWEGYNRAVYAFNDTVDRYVMKPVAKGYRAITPDPVEESISNLFSNLNELRNVLNDALQWKWGQAANDSGRFLVNSTVGVVGLFDVAKHLGLEKSDGEDFGQTLANWGMGQGPYLVLPFLGPSTLRDLGGLPADIYLDPVVYIDHVPTRNTLRGSGFVVQRASLLEAEKLASGDRYLFMRDAYLQRREYLINDGDVEDDFGGDFDSEYDF